MKSIIIDLLPNDHAQIPVALEGCLIIRSFAVPDDYDLALQQAKRILDSIPLENFPPQILTIFIPERPYAFGMCLTIGDALCVRPRVVVETKDGFVDLWEFFEAGRTYAKETI